MYAWKYFTYEGASALRKRQKRLRVSSESAREQACVLEDLWALAG